MTTYDDRVIVASTDAGVPTAVLESVEGLHAHMRQIEVDEQGVLNGVAPRYRRSARNLLHYLALRQHDIRPLQTELAKLGLSSLGRTESHVLATVEAVLARLRDLSGKAAAVVAAPQEATLLVEEGEALLTEHTEELLGAMPPDRIVRIMVTLPSEAATDYALVRDLVQHGVNVMRINCAHDDPEAWSAMVANVRNAQAELDLPCRIVMDLPGPKLRTGAMAPGERIAVWKPVRNEQGQVTQPARIWLTRETDPGSPDVPGAPVVRLPDVWVNRLRVGDSLGFVDLRGKKRRLTVTEQVDGGYWAELTSTAYVGPKTVLRARQPLRARLGDRKFTTKLGDVPATEQVLVLQRGDRLVLTAAAEPGTLAVCDEDGAVVQPARISCTLPEVFADVRVGDRIFFDDGKIGSVVLEVGLDEVTVEITQTGLKGAKLRADKGINLPDSDLHISGLTEQDHAALAFIVGHADIVELSFAEDLGTLQELMDYLTAHRGEEMGIVLKIETQRGFARLPHLLFTAMGRFPTGVMIARGDLAVECGWERLAEVQDEMLWICEAAHVPTVWATQVLETLVKTGLPSRAEITDAASGVQAECVMLNKGPHVLAAVDALSDILRRMQDHQHKKSAMLRELKVSSEPLS